MAAPLFSACFPSPRSSSPSPLLFAITTILERKGLGRIQNRYGPNRVGPYGLLQPLADGLKALTKEDVVPHTADKVVHFLAPLVLVVPVFLALAVVPVGRNMAALDIDAGVLFFFAVGAATELSVFMAGWSSRNKYSLLGAMRAIAQMISYEVPLILSAVTVIMAAGSLSTVKIVEAQAGYWGVLAAVVCADAVGTGGVHPLHDCRRPPSRTARPSICRKVNRRSSPVTTPSIPGSSSRCSSSANTWACSPSAAWASRSFSAAGTRRLPASDWIPSWVWFFAKLLALIAVFIWVRGTLPRLRLDQLMGFAWKLMLPMALANILAAGVWRFMPAGAVRWIVCSILVAVPYLMLGRLLAGRKQLARTSLSLCGLTCLTVHDLAFRHHRRVDPGQRRGRHEPAQPGALRADADGDICGLAAFYLQLDAQFVGFAQVLIYIGAVAILIVFAIC